MNLTVQALESMSGNCKKVIDSGILDCYEDKLHEFKLLKDTADGCLHVINDLMTCKESLETVGYSQQWLDIINKDNKFLTVCNIEMPKFFGGDEAKGKACMEGVMDTITVWLKKAWEIIKKIFAFMIAAFKTVIDYFNREASNSNKKLENTFKAREAFVKHYRDAQAKMTATSEAPVTFGAEKMAEVIKIETVDNYLALLERFYGRLGLALQPNGLTMAPNGMKGVLGFALAHLPGESGNAVMDVFSQLAQIAGDSGAKNKIEEDGFLVTSQGMKFLELDAIPTEKINVLDDTAWKTVEEGLKNIKARAQRLNLALAALQKDVAKYQKYLEDNQLAELVGKGQPVPSNISLEDIRMVIERVKALYPAITSAVTFARTIGTKVDLTLMSINNALRK